jgi:hypothetical protein
MRVEEKRVKKCKQRKNILDLDKNIKFKTKSHIKNEILLKLLIFFLTFYFIIIWSIKKNVMFLVKVMMLVE